MDKYIFPTDPIAKKEAIIKGEKYRFTVLTDGLVRCEWADDGKFEDRASTFAINRNLEVPKFTVVESDDGTLDITTARFNLTYNKTRFTPSTLTVNVLGGIVNWGARWRYGDYSSSVGGTARTLDEVDGRCELGPGVISRNGFSAIDDHETMLFESDGWVSGRPAGYREDIYVFAYGRDYTDAIDAFYQVSGKQPVIPRWALGNWWSRYYAYSADEYLSLMDKFKENEVPLAVADMDWHLVDDPKVKHSGWTGYSWNKELFPDPQGFLDGLRERQLKVCPNDHPAEGIWSHEDVYEFMAKETGHDTKDKTPIQFDCTSKKYMQAYLKMFTKLGFDFNWIDWQQGPYSKIPGVDPLWVLNHFFYLENGASGSKPLIFSRYGGPGSHRYPVGFSGDTIVTWESLDFQPEFTATASNIGYGWWSHDIGGHMGGIRDDEMATRWVQLGVFSPILRLHSNLSQWTSKEPWEYNPEAQQIMKSMLVLRHELIPYLYSMNILGSRSNRPLVQPVYWLFPNVDEAYNFRNSFLFGSQLFVSPITTPRDKRTGLGACQTWLPPVSGSKCRFVDIFTGTVYDAGRVITLHRSLSQIPVLAPEGSIIPFNKNDFQNGTKNPVHMSLTVVVGTDGRFDLIEDNDGEKAEGEETEEWGTTISWQQEKGVLTILPADKKSTKNSARLWQICFASALEDIDPSSVKISVDGERKDADAIGFEDDGYARGLCLRLSLVPITSKIEIEVGKAPQLNVQKIGEVVKRMLKNYQVSFEIKDMIWSIVDDGTITPSIKASRLLELNVDKALLGPILELLLADSKA